MALSLVADLRTFVEELAAYFPEEGGEGFPEEVAAGVSGETVAGVVFGEFGLVAVCAMALVKIVTTENIATSGAKLRKLQMLPLVVILLSSEMDDLDGPGVRP
jgi:hypothetical protein